MRFFGVDSELSSQARNWALTFLSAWPLWVILFVVVGVLLLVIALYRREKPGLPLRDVIIFTALRSLALVVLLAMIWQPAVIWEIPQEREATLLLVLDDSQSMSVPDRYDGSAELMHVVRALWPREMKDFGGTQVAELPADRRAELGSLTRAGLVNRLLAGDRKDLERLEKEFNVQVYFASEVLRGAGGDQEKGPAEPGAKPPLGELKIEPTGAVTRLGDLVREAVNQHRGQVAAVVLVSDGAVNVGEDLESAARHLARREIRTYTVGVGDARPPRDLRIRSAEANRVVLEGDIVSVDVELESEGFRGETVGLTVTRDGQPVSLIQTGSERVVLAEETSEVDGKKIVKPQPVRLAFRADKEGTFTYTVAVENRPEELITDNNRVELPIRVLREKMKVLYAEGPPRWEYRYLVALLTRDETIDVSCWLGSADFEFAPEGNIPISYFPSKPEDLFAYDMVIIGDLPRTDLSDDQMKNIVKLVDTVGGGLLMIAGEHHAPLEYRGSVLEKLLPVDLDPRGLAADALVASDRAQAWHPVLTPEGELHPQTRFLSDVEDNRRLWASLPGFFWHYPIARAKPGASVLLEHPFARSSFGPEPLLAVQHYGAGKVGFLAMDETWRWRDRVGDRFQARFWGQVVRDLTQNKLIGKSKRFRLSSSKSKYRLGEKVDFYARILDANYEPLKLPEVEVKVEVPGLDAVTLKLTAVEGEPGKYHTEYLPQVSGRFRATLATHETGLLSESITHEFIVAPSLLEFQDARMNEDGLMKLAELTGGKYFHPDEFGNLADSILQLKASSVREVTSELWNAPVLFVVFAGLFVTELIYRKRRKLL